MGVGARALFRQHTASVLALCGQAASYCMSLRGAKRRGNPLSCGRTKRKGNTFGEYAPSAHFPWYYVLATADARQISACHCEERRDNPLSCGRTKRKAILWANTESVTNLPKQQPTCPVSLRRRGLPHQCAHWFAMTCRNLPGVCGCKNVVHNDMLKTGTRLRMHGRGARWHLPHCHCEERSDVAIRSPAVGQNRKAILWANTESVTDFPWESVVAHADSYMFLHVIARSEATGQSALLR